MIEPGSPAPDFTLQTRTDRGLARGPSRADHRARLLPARLQPGLHRPAERLPRGAAELEERATTLYGVSVDSAYAHKAFQEHLGIAIPLLADFHPKGEVARRYGVYTRSAATASARS